MSKKIFWLAFIFILSLGTFLRFYQLGSVPGSLEWDEVSFGYNAYSVLQTGKDEYGETLPMVFRAFGEYKQPVYLYLNVVSVSLFGLTSFAVRFPSAFFGSISVIFVFLLVYELFKRFNFSKNLALLSMVFFAISPWSIQFSRGAFEANVALSFVIAAMWLFIRGLNYKKSLYIFIATFLLALSTYTYLSQKLVAPVLFLALLVYGYPFLKKKRVLAFTLVAFFVVLNAFWVIDSKSTSRGQGVLFTTNQTEILAPSIKQLQKDREANNYVGMLLHNRRVVYLQTLGNNYLAHFNPLWLFVTGDKVNRHHAPGMGLIYLFSVPLILAGMYFLLSKTFSTSWILFVLFLLAPIPASLTFEAPHSLRSLIFLPTWQIFEAAGLLALGRVIFNLKHKALRVLFLGVCVFLFAFNFVYYLHQYFIHTNTDFQKDWQYGYRQAIEHTATYSNTDKRIVFANSFEQPYIFYLFYVRLDPSNYISSGGSDRTSKKCYAIDNAYFGSCIDRLRRGDIYVTTGNESIPRTKAIKEFKFESGEVATKVYQYE